jgi:flagellar biosynthetic protein FliO
MDLLYQLSAVGLVLGLLAVALWALRRRGFVAGGSLLRSRKAGSRLEPLERLVLSPHHTLHLVRVADRALLIGAHAAGCTLLDAVPLSALDPKKEGEAR